LHGGLSTGPKTAEGIERIRRAIEASLVHEESMASSRTTHKRNGKVFRTSTATESADRMTMTVENEFIDPGDGRVTGKMTETYVRK
jgi:hypothetical protein